MNSLPSPDPAVNPPIQIPLTRGQVTIVDTIDADLAQLKWYAKPDRYGYYAARFTQKKQTIRLHRVVMGRILGRELARNEQVDHIDGNPLNNRRSNLRIATNSQNQFNARLRKDNRSGLKGVRHNKGENRWYARFKIDGKDIYLGSFDTPEEAHAAYLAAAQKYAGDFARER